MSNIFKLMIILVFMLLYSATKAYPQVVINEIHAGAIAGPGSTTNSNSLYNTNIDDLPAANKEWIELYNTDPCNSADISCFTLGCNMEPPAGSGYQNWGAFTFPPGTIIPPGGFIIVGGNASQVPVLDFDLNYYRQTTFGTQWLDGNLERWFLRDEYGWVALYNISGIPVDAVYWDYYGDPGNLYIQEEYKYPVETFTSCSGFKQLPAAVNITGIEYAGQISPGTWTSFQRLTDGSTLWYASPVIPTPRDCNSSCSGPPQITVNVSSESCNGNDGGISITVTGGATGPYNVEWINPALGIFNSINNLSAGSYIVKIYDNVNCFVKWDTIVVTNNFGPSILVDHIINETCSASNGSAEIIAGGNNQPFSYLWNSNPQQYDNTLDNVSAGTYTVTVTDNIGCSADKTVTITNSPGPQIVIDTIINDMCTKFSGAIYTNITGGTSPLYYSWNSAPVQSSKDLLNVTAGNYSITVTDANGCKDYVTGTVTDVPPPIVTFSDIEDETCHMGNGKATINISGGNPPYSFYWEGFPEISAYTNDQLSEGVNNVFVTDSFCTTISSVIIANIPGPEAEFTVYPEATTIESPRIKFTDKSTGKPDDWYWEFGDRDFSFEQNPTHIYKDTGTYKVSLFISNDKGCTDSISHNAIILDRIKLFIPNSFSPNGDGHNEYFKIFGTNITNFTIYIYDRWGEMVFKSEDITNSWNGKYGNVKAISGVYSWIIFYSEDYKLFHSDRKMLKGHVTLLR